MTRSYWPRSNSSYAQHDLERAARERQIVTEEIARAGAAGLDATELRALVNGLWTSPPIVHAGEVVKSGKAVLRDGRYYAVSPAEAHP